MPNQTRILIITANVFLVISHAEDVKLGAHQRATPKLQLEWDDLSTNFFIFKVSSFSWKIFELNLYQTSNDIDPISFEFNLIHSNDQFDAQSVDRQWKKRKTLRKKMWYNHISAAHKLLIIKSDQGTMVGSHTPTSQLRRNTENESQNSNESHSLDGIQIDGINMKSIRMKSYADFSEASLIISGHMPLPLPLPLAMPLSAYLIWTSEQRKENETKRNQTKQISNTYGKWLR